MTADPTSLAPTYERDGDTGATAYGPCRGRHSTDPTVLMVIEGLMREVEQLRTAQHSNRRIGMAMGIVMNQLEVEDQEAFDVLRRISQHTNRKLRNVAEDVIRDRHV